VPNTTKKWCWMARKKT